MIGIELEINNIREDDIYSIFENINTELYTFELCEYEIIDKEGLNIKCNSIKDIISKNGKSIIFLNLQLYSKSSTDKKRIISYNDFKNSDCLLILLVTDNRYIEIYFNDNILENKILKALDKNKLEYEIKTVDNDGRLTLSVL